MPDTWKKNITLFLISQTISMLGSALTQYAMIWYVTLTTQSGMMMTLSTLCTFLPQVFISLFAGVWADRYNRKVLIILADALVALSTLGLAIAFMSGYRELWLLFLVAGIRSVGTGIQVPTVNALIPQLTPEDKLMRINGINGTLQTFTMLVAPAVSGALLASSTVEAAFFVDVATAAIGISCFAAFVAVPRPIPAENGRDTVLTDLMIGVRYTLSHPFVRGMLIFYGVLMFLVSPAVFLTPLLIARDFADEIWHLTANELAYSAGATIGGFMISIWGGWKDRTKTIAVFTILYGLLSIALGLSPWFILFLVCIFCVGITVPFITTPFIVALQERVEEGMMGRVFSILQIIGTAAMPLGMVLFGPLADIVNIRILIVGTSVVTLFTAFLLRRSAMQSPS
jgi:DHA3 family macrolide efflux protein-like MFS transporter